MLQKHTGEIMDNSSLTEKQQEEKITQVFDLCHFIKCYNQPLSLVDSQEHKIMTVDDQGTRKGIYFCDLIYNTRYFFDRYFFNLPDISTYKTQSKVNELWFVLVEESFSLDYFRDSEDFIEKNNVAALYDRVFYFNFSRSIIKILK